MMAIKIGVDLLNIQVEFKQDNSVTQQTDLHYPYYNNKKSRHST